MNELTKLAIAGTVVATAVYGGIAAVEKICEALDVGDDLNAYDFARAIQDGFRQWATDHRLDRWDPSRPRKQPPFNFEPGAGGL